MPIPHEDLDKELDPKRLKFGMSKTEIEKVVKNFKEKKRRKKLAKNWKPGH